MRRTPVEVHEAESFGPTYPGRYETLDLPDNAEYCMDDWPISHVFSAFPHLQRIASLGTSVGINESILAAAHPQKSFVAIDGHREALSVSHRGTWNFEQFGFSFPAQEETRRLLNRFCPEPIFVIEGRQVIRRQTVSNLSHCQAYFDRLPFGNDTFDMVMSHAAMNAMCIEDDSVRGLSNNLREVCRVLRKNGIFWIDGLLFQWTGTIMHRLENPAFHKPATKGAHHHTIRDTVQRCVTMLGRSER